MSRHLAQPACARRRSTSAFAIALRAALAAGALGVALCPGIAFAQQLQQSNTCEEDKEKRAEELRKRISVYEQRLAVAKDELAAAQADADEASKLAHEARTKAYNKAVEEVKKNKGTLSWDDYSKAYGTADADPEYRKWNGIASNRNTKIQTLTNRTKRLERDIAGYKKELDDLNKKPCPPKTGEIIPPTIDLVPDIAPGPIEPMSLPGQESQTASVSGYIGGFVGASMPESGVRWQPNPLGFGFDALFLSRHARFTFDDAEVTGGGQVGVDVRLPSSFLTSYDAVPPIYAGVVYDFAVNGGGTQASNRVFISPFGGAFPTQQSFASDYTSTMRAVFGFEKTFLDGASSVGLRFPFVANIRPYATAGFAFGYFGVSDSIYFGGPFFNQGQWSGLRTGWAAGGGVRIGTGPLGDVQIQYLHIDLGAIEYVAPHSAIPAASILTSHSFREDRVTVGFNFNLSAFGSQRPPVFVPGF
jgi:hypothetical protein